MGIVECFSKSLYDFKAYGKMKGNSAGKVVLYLFLIACLFGGISSITTLTSFKKTKEQILYEVESANPKIENGILSFDGGQKTKEFVVEGYKVVIDTSDSSVIDNLDGVGIVIGSKDIKVKNYSMETLTKTYKELNVDTLDKSHVIEAVRYLSKIFMPIIFAAYILYNFVGGFVLALFIAFILLAVSSVMKGKLRFGEVYKVSIYILTPIYLINTVLIFIGISLSFYFQVLIGLIFGFVIIKSIIQDEIV